MDHAPPFSFRIIYGHLKFTLKISQALYIDTSLSIRKLSAKDRVRIPF